MKCFENFIGIRGGCDNAPSPDSGLYIEDLPLMTVKNLASITSEAYLSAHEMVKRKMVIAGDYLLGKVLDGFRMKLTLNQLQDQRTSGGFTENIIAARPGEYGIKTYKIPSALTSLRLLNLQFKAAQKGSTTIKITDGITTINKKVTFEAGQIVYEMIELSTFQQDIRVTVDTTTLDVYETTIKGGCGCDYDTIYFSGLTPTGIDSISPGLILHAGSECSEVRMKCMLRMNFEHAFLHMTGVEVLKEAKGDRLGWLNIHGDPDKMSDEWLAFVQAEIDTKSDQAFHFLKTLDSSCMTCNGMQNGYLHP